VKAEAHGARRLLASQDDGPLGRFGHHSFATRGDERAGGRQAQILRAEAGGDGVGGGPAGDGELGSAGAEAERRAARLVVGSERVEDEQVGVEVGLIARGTEELGFNTGLGGQQRLQGLGIGGEDGDAQAGRGGEFKLGAVVGFQGIAGFDARLQPAGGRGVEGEIDGDVRVLRREATSAPPTPAVKGTWRVAAP
jgi:hypothetical protein